jgi:AcrR family transcriptional regulator
MDPYNVKMDRPYHHGNLRAAVLQAAEQLLDERGVDGFSLREVARRAGVSPAAPKHHFSDVRGLLTAIAERAFDELATWLERAKGGEEGDRADHVRRQGEAYVKFALAHPARFDLMWRVALLDTDDAGYRRASTRAYAALDELVRGADAPPLEKHDPRLATTMTCWSVVHGFARLALDGTFGTSKSALTRAVTRLLPAILRQIKL